MPSSPFFAIFKSTKNFDKTTRKEQLEPKNQYIQSGGNMKTKGYIFTFILVLFLFISKEPIYASETRVVSDAEGFHAALTDENVSVIEISETIGSLVGSGNDPLIISRPVTIRGGGLELWYVGIVLGADVTFENVEISFTSAESNAIVANGYTLTLDGVTRGSNVQWDTHVFCGGIVGYSYSNIPAAGDHGEVIIKGNSYLGNIYAGNMAHSGVSASQYMGSASITIDSTVSGTIGAIYGSGGREVMGEGDGNAVTTGAEYSVSGDIDVTLYDSKVQNVVGFDEKLAVKFQGSGNLGIPKLENISSLEVLSGALQPAAGSSFSVALPNISLKENGVLFLNNYGEMSIGNFEGGGGLVLAKDQKITIDGTITGTTNAYIGHNGFPESPADNHTYIEAVKAEAGNFTFNGSSSNPTYVPIFVSNDAGGGIWTTTEEAETIIKVTEFGMEDYSMEEADDFLDWIEMPVSIAYTTQSNDYIDVLELEVWVNDKKAEIVYDGDYVCYQTDEVYCYPYSVGDECVLVVWDSGYQTVPQDGKYHFSITIPGEYTESGSPLTAEATLTLGKIEEEIPEEIPEGIRVEGVDENGYEYTGEPIKPKVQVYDGKYLLRNRVDYTITYKNNINANEANGSSKVPTMIISGKGNYSGNVTVTFDIHPKNIEEADAADLFGVENGKVQKLNPIVKDGKKTLRKDYHYTIEYPDMGQENPDAYKVAGEYDVLIRGKGNYTGTKTIKMVIDTKKLIRQATVTKIGNQNYTGEKIEPVIMLKYQGDTLIREKDYTLTYVNNVDVGTAAIVIQGIGDYFGEKQINFKIVEMPQGTNAVANGEAGLENKYEDGSTAAESGNGPEDNTSVDYNSMEQGETVNGKNDSYNIRNVKIKVSSQIYSPEGVTLDKEDVIIVSGQQDVEYEVIGYKNNHRKGTAIAYIKGLGDYSGTKIVKFKIKSKNLEITMATK